VIDTPGNSPPCGSTTLPLIEPVVRACAEVKRGVMKNTSSMMPNGVRQFFAFRSVTEILRPSFMMCSPKKDRAYRKMLRPGGNGRVTEVATKDEVR
jgi:hypothetical protein